MVWQPGTILGGKYQIEAVLSRQGGFGITYRALHTVLRDRVVIKSPHAYRQNEPNYADFVTCFEREGRNLARLAEKQHANIVKVRDFFYEDAVPCLVMDYVNGETLEAIVLQEQKLQKTLPEETVVAWIVTIAQALDRVHELGLVHRDANPANIIINQDQQAILIDFGIALNIQPRATTTIAAFAGHQDFAPLEQLEPEAERLDCATRDPKLDIYCLAATLYFAMTGERPKGAHSRSISLARKGKDALVLPQALRPEISDRIHHAILVGMEMEPDDRPTTMQEWITLLTTDDGLLSKITPPTLESLPIEPITFTTIELNARGEVMAQPEKSVQAFDQILPGDLRLKMILLPAGSFGMGAPEDELDHYSDETPQHQVTVPRFAIAQTPITQAQWAAIAQLPKVKRKLNSAPSYFSGDDRPVERVNWFEAVEFCDRLTRFCRRPYRLPSEAEWEYACRAGTTTAFNLGATMTTEFANYRGTDDVRADRTLLGNYGEGPKGVYRGQTTAVRSFPPNGTGLYDMHGNVWEWCADHWHAGYENPPTDGTAWLDFDADENSDRVVRGGSYDISPQNCRSAIRNFNAPDNRYNFIGFRVVLSLSPRTLP
jgi:formylglycine-generating enzyme required for sulfatase activity/tRNA A-37 threonylcarbamoyl transferase component Bud32